MLLSLHSDLWKLWKLVFHFFQKGNWCSVPFSSQPFGCEFCKFHKERFSFGRIFLFGIIYSISPFPSAETEGITVISSFSCPVVLASTDFGAFVSSIIVLVGISRQLEFCLHCLFLVRYSHVCGLKNYVVLVHYYFFKVDRKAFLSDELLTSYDPTVTSFEILLQNLQRYSSFWALHLYCLSSSRWAIL